MDTYGKKAEQMPSINQVFQMVLGRFEYHVVEAAFKIYMESHSVMPKPADIVKIIEPPQEARKWCGATYIQLCKRKRENQFMLDRELKYISDFEVARTTAPEEQRGLIEDAISNNAVADSRYWLEG